MLSEKRIAALRRMLDEYDAGLGSGVTKNDFAHVIGDLLDEVELLRRLFLEQRLGVRESPEQAAMVATFEEVF